MNQMKSTLLVAGTLVLVFAFLGTAFFYLVAMPILRLTNYSVLAFLASYPLSMFFVVLALRYWRDAISLFSRAWTFEVCAALAMLYLFIAVGADRPWLSAMTAAAAAIWFLTGACYARQCERSGG